jgi:hypothetical protein
MELGGSIPAMLLNKMGKKHQAQMLRKYRNKI